MLDQALRTVAADGNVKFYGGEPTLHAAAIIDAMRYLRERGFRGLFTIFSNGVKAEKLHRDPGQRRAQRSRAQLLHLPRSRRRAAAGARQDTSRSLGRAHPNRIFQGYKILFHAGAGAERSFDRDREADFHGLGRGCVRCFPGPHLARPLPRLPVRRRDRLAALRPRRYGTDAGHRLRQLPCLPPLDRRRARPDGSSGAA